MKDIALKESTYDHVVAIFEEVGYEGSDHSEPRRWVGRKGNMAVEIAGDPVTSITFVNPPNEGFGLLCSKFTHLLFPGPDGLRLSQWMHRTLVGHAKDKRALDSSAKIGAGNLRLQSMLGLIVVTWS